MKAFLISLFLMMFHRILFLRNFSQKLFIGNVVKVKSNQEETESNMEIGGERIESIVETEGDREGYNVETKENDTKKCVLGNR